MNELLGRNASRPPAAKHRVPESRRNRAHCEMLRGTAWHGEVQPQAYCRENRRAQCEGRETMRPKAAVLEVRDRGQHNSMSEVCELPRCGSGKRTVAA